MNKPIVVQSIKKVQYLGVTQQVSSVCPFQVFHLKTETREAGRVTHKCCL